MRELTEGYHIFSAICTEDRGFEKAAMDVQAQINEAEKIFDITFIGGPTFKDDPGSRSVFFSCQAAVLKRKPKEKKS